MASGSETMSAVPSTWIHSPYHASLPDAMELLVDYYRRVAGEHPDWAEYRRAMVDEKRCLIRITVERAGPDRRG